MYLHTWILMQRHYNSVFVLTVAAQQDSNKVIAHPGKGVVLICDLTPRRDQTAAWLIDNGQIHTLQQLRNGILTGYSSRGNNLIIENIKMNDDRNNTEYICVTVSSTVSNPTLSDIEDENAPTILYVVGEYQYAL